MFAGKLVFDSHFVGRPGYWGFNPTIDNQQAQAYFQAEPGRGEAVPTLGDGWEGAASLSVVDTSGSVVARIQLTSAVWQLDNNANPMSPTEKRQMIDFFGEGSDLIGGNVLVQMTQVDDTQATITVSPIA